MKMQFKVTYPDGAEKTVTVSAVDFVAFEGEFNRSVARFQDEFRLTDMYWLTWHALRRADKSTPDFNKWLEVDDPAVAFGDEEEIVPLESDQ